MELKRASQALQLDCTVNVYSMVASSNTEQLKQFVQTLSIHSYTCSLLKCFIFNFVWNLPNGFENRLQQ